MEDGFDLDQYLFRSSGSLNFSIDVARDLGPVDANGHPAASNALFGKTGRLTLRSFDVDDDARVEGYQPEVDLVVVNGVALGVPLSGADQQWSINTLQLPLSLLRLPTPSNPNGRNDIEVRIDTANTGEDVWATEVD